MELIDAPDSSLAKLLIKKWSWGLISAVEVHDLASHALEDQKAVLSSLGICPTLASKSLPILASYVVTSRFAIFAGAANVPGFGQVKSLLHTTEVQWSSNDSGSRSLFGGPDAKAILDTEMG